MLGSNLSALWGSAKDSTRCNFTSAFFLANLGRTKAKNPKKNELMNPKEFENTRRKGITKLRICHSCNPFNVRILD